MRNNRRRGELINLGQLRVDSGRNRVTIGSETQVVRPQVMDLLVYLAKQRNQVVSTEQILEDIWVDKVVTKASIYQTMAELRRVIAAADDVRVETIKRRGYRLSAPSPDDSSSALQAHSAAPEDTVKRSSNRSRMALWAVFFALLGLLVFEIYRQQTATPESFDRLRSEVLEAVRRDAESSGNIDPDKAEQIVDDMLSELMLESGPAQRRAVELLAAGDPDEAAKELAELGEQLADGAEVDDKVAQAFRNADEAASELAELGDRLAQSAEVDEKVAQAFRNAGSIASSVDTLAAITAYEKALEFSPGDYEVLNQLALLYYLSGKVDDARQQYLKIMELPEAANPAVHALVLSNMGKLEQRRNVAEPMLQEALAIHQELDDQEGTAANLSALRRFAPTVEEQMHLIVQQRNISAEIGDYEGVAQALGDQGVALSFSAAAVEGVEFAAFYTQAALEIYEAIYAGRITSTGTRRFIYDEIGVLSGIGTEAANLAWLLNRMGRPQSEYMPHLERALEAGKKINDLEVVTIVSLDLAAEAALLGDIGKAEKYMNEALVLAPPFRDWRNLRATLSRTRAIIHLARGNFIAACSQVNAALAEGLVRFEEDLSRLSEQAGCREPGTLRTSQ